VDLFQSHPSLRVELYTNPAAIDTFADAGQEAVIPLGRKVVGTPGSCLHFHAWSHKLGGVDLGATRIRLAVTGLSEGGVEIEQMRAHVLKPTKKPLGGTPLLCPSGGEAAVRAIRIDLDSPNPLAYYVTHSRRRPFAFTFKKGETEDLDVVATTKKCYCRWYLELRERVAGKSHPRTIKEDGQPFETSAARDTSSYAWDFKNSWNLVSGFGVSPPVPTSRLHPIWR
jgi:hypothetical protein